jgi:hypothetical protein
MKANRNGTPAKIAEEVDLVNRNGTNELGCELPILDLDRKLPHEVADNESTYHEHGKVVLNDVCFTKAGNRLGSHCTHPNQGHGEHRERVCEDPDDAINAIGYAVFEVDSEQGKPFAEGSNHYTEV